MEITSEVSVGAGVESDRDTGDTGTPRDRRVGVVTGSETATDTVTAAATGCSFVCLSASTSNEGATTSVVIETFVADAVVAATSVDSAGGTGAARRQHG